MPVYTLFSQTGGGTSASDSASYTMGIQFSVSVSGSTLTAIWFYSASGSFSLPATIALYAVTGQTLVHSETASWSGAIGSGWVRAAFTTPPALTSGTNYKACILNNDGNFFYSGTPHYFDTGPGGSGLANGPLSAPGNAGGDGGQDTFAQSALLSYPASSFNANNYWVDPEINVPVTAGTSALAGGGGLASGAVTAAPVSAGGSGALATAETIRPAASVAGGAVLLATPGISALALAAAAGIVTAGPADSAPVTVAGSSGVLVPAVTAAAAQIRAGGTISATGTVPNAPVAWGYALAGLQQTRIVARAVGVYIA